MKLFVNLFQNKLQKKSENLEKSQKQSLYSEMFLFQK